MIPLLLTTTFLDPDPIVHSVKISIAEDVAPSDKVQVNVNTQNVRSIVLSATPIDGEKWLSIPKQTSRPAPIRSAVKTWTLAVAKPDQKPNPNQADTYYSRQTNLPKLKPGVYLIDAKGGDKDDWAVVNVTELAVVVKRSPKRALVWVTDFKTGKVAPNCLVRYYDRKGRLSQSQSTGSDGATLMNLSADEGAFVVRRAKDIAGIGSTQENPDGALTAHFETDRPTYRPGQTVQFKAILRRTVGYGYRPVQQADCVVQLRDPKENPIEELHLKSNQMGTVSGSVSIPAEGATGPYTLFLQNGKDSTYQSLSVAAYRKPEFKVEVKPLQNRYLAGQELGFEVDANYFFGSPVPQAQVHYRLMKSRLSFERYDSVTQAFYSGDGNLYATDTYQSDAFLGEDNVFTDENGRAFIKLKTGMEPGDYTVSASCTVSDASHRQVEGSASVPVYGAAIRLGLSSTISYATLGTLFPVAIRLEDLDGNPASGTVQLDLKKKVYDFKKNEWNEVLMTHTSVKVGAKGLYRIQLPAKSEGDLRLYAKCPDGLGHVAQNSLDIYVAGNYEAPAPEKAEPKLGIRLDKKEYRPDDVASALISTNHPRAPILMVLQGSEIWDYQVVPVSHSLQSWKIKTGLRLAPNAYVTAAEWVKGSLLSANEILPVPDRSKALRISIKPDKKSYEPGDKASYAIHAEDGHGSPVSAEVAVGVVDEAIFSMLGDQTADIYRLFWGLKGDFVSTESSAPQELSGGAYQRVNALAPVRQRFEDTAFWNPTVNTDRNGNGQIDFEMPGNLTTWRATAYAITEDTKVGSASTKVIATRPVTLRLQTPRQMVAGDRITIVGAVNNRTNSAHTFEIRIDPGNIEVEGLRTQTVKVPPRSEGKVEWTAVARTLPADGAATLAGQVEATDAPGAEFADALRVEIPITPNGLPSRSIMGGSLTDEAKIPLDLSPNRIAPATKVRVEVRAGLRPVLTEATSSIMDSGRFGTVGGANQLEVASLLRLPQSDEHVRESLALLARLQGVQGWGWWEGSNADPVLTARVLTVLAECRASGIRVFDNIFDSAKEAAFALYSQTHLWEHRALLASALASAGDSRGEQLLHEVSSQGKSMSPFALLHLANGYLAAGRRDDARKVLDQALVNVDLGSNETYVPAGEGAGWGGSDIETTAEALYVLAKVGLNDSLQEKLATWLASADQAWRSPEEDAAIVRALSTYLKIHPEDTKLSNVSVLVNDVSVPVTPSTVDQSVSSQVPYSLLRDGKNEIELKKSGSGQAFYSIESRVVLPNTDESTSGIRVLRRYEVKNSGGVWVELNRPIKIGEPVKCIVFAWGDSLRDAMRVSEPIPAGFEFIEDQSPSGGEQDVRDGSVVQYLVNSDAPQTFSYYLRSESDGVLNTLPATAEYVRRPRLRGNTQPLRFTVSGK